MFAYTEIFAQISGVGIVMHFESEVLLGHTTWAAYNSYFPRIEKTMMLHL